MILVSLFPLRCYRRPTSASVRYPLTLCPSKIFYKPSENTSCSGIGEQSQFRVVAGIVEYDWSHLLPFVSHPGLSV